MFSRISDHANLIRNMDTNVVLNNDNDAFNAYINSRNRIATQNSKIVGLEEQVSILTSELSNIKNLLNTIIV